MNMTLLLWPPVAFVIVLLAVLALSAFLSRFAFRPSEHARDQREPYACGEPEYNHTVRPDYSLFFPFAFFFTIAHVAALIVTTVPAENAGVFVLALLYVAGAVTGLYVLMRDK